MWSHIQPHVSSTRETSFPLCPHAEHGWNGSSLHCLQKELPNVSKRVVNSSNKKVNMSSELKEPVLYSVTSSIALVSPPCPLCSLLGLSGAPQPLLSRSCCHSGQVR